LVVRDPADEFGYPTVHKTFAIRLKRYNQFIGQDLKLTVAIGWLPIWPTFF